MQLGPHVMHWANRFLSQINIVEAINALVSKRRDISDFMVTLAILDKGEALKSSSLPLGSRFGWEWGLLRRFPPREKQTSLPARTSSFVNCTARPRTAWTCRNSDLVTPECANSSFRFRVIAAIRG